MSKRTSHTVITSRFMLICAPFGIILALILAPWAIIVLPVFFGTLSLFWLFAQGFTNLFVKVVDPDGYKAIKEIGGDPFYDSLGVPLNFDSDAVRRAQPVQKRKSANTRCPHCHVPMLALANLASTCGGCGLRWHENNWWQWTGKQWIFYAYGPGQRPRQQQQRQQQQRQQRQPQSQPFWTGQNKTTT